METRDYNEDLAIDIDELDKNWIDQAALYMYYAEQEAIANSDKTRAKEALDITEATLDASIRRSPKDYGFEGKTTEAAIKNTILLDPVYRQKMAEYIDVSGNHAIIKAAVFAFDHRKNALSNLVQLQLGGYNSQPKIPKKATEKIAEKISVVENTNTKKRLLRNKK